MLRDLLRIVLRATVMLRVKVIVVLLLFVAVVLAVLGLGVMLLWNWLASGLFGVPHVNLPQAVGLVVAFIFLRNLLIVKV